VFQDRFTGQPDIQARHFIARLPDQVPQQLDGFGLLPGGARPGGRKSRRDQKLADRRAAGRGNRRGRFSEPEPEPEAEAEPAPEVAAEAKPYDQAEVSQPGADAPQPADVTSD